MKILRLAAVVLLLALGAIGHAEAKTVMFKVGEMPVTGWLPDDYKTSGKKYPLLLFSHGFGGCPAQSRFLTEGLAKDGYIVLAPRHHDARCGLASGADVADTLGQGLPQQPFRFPYRWTKDTYSDRRDDMIHVLDYALSDKGFKPYVDKENIGAIGHSLGGYTVLGLAGAWSDWQEPRIKAVLALSPFSDPYLVHATLKEIVIPVMFQGGTKDFGITPVLKRSNGVYDNTPKPKYFVDLDGAAHSAWTERSDTYHGVIYAYSKAFLDHYLKGAAAPLLSEAGGKQLAGYRADP